jgi:hypothetical protein
MPSKGQTVAPFGTEAHFPILIFHFTLVIIVGPSLVNPMGNEKWQMTHGKWGL